ncbi:MAG: hypothetical protein E7509_05215 [Ruminococcus sp.]|nr:hypothetical protein [Ruminococcus sp.]
MSEYNKYIPEDDEAYERRLYEEQKALANKNTEEYKKAQRDAQRKREEERRKQLAQDKIELMKLKSGVIEESETIKEEEKVERVLSFKEKVANFFYHYKIPVIVGTAFSIALAFIVYDTVTRRKPDMYVLSTCNNGLEFRTEALQDYFEQFCEDLNDDGEVYVQVITAPTTNDFQANEGNQAKILTQLQMDKTIIILTSDGNYNLESKRDENGLYTEDNYVFADIFDDLRKHYPDNESVDEKGYHFDGDSLKEALGWEEMPDNVILSMRKPVRALGGSYKKMEKNYRIAKDVLEQIMKDNGDL